MKGRFGCILLNVGCGNFMGKFLRLKWDISVGSQNMEDRHEILFGITSEKKVHMVTSCLTPKNHVFD